MPKIYESPDGGITIRAREIGDPISSTITITSGTPTTLVGNGFGDPGNITLTSPTDPLEEYLQKRLDMMDKYPELKEKWEEFAELERHYKAWELLNAI
jgi:hypothetical protein